MIKIFTQNDLIRFMYHETTEEETTEIERALICDAELQERFSELLAMKKKVDEVTLEPSRATILNILSYAKNATQNVEKR